MTQIEDLQALNLEYLKDSRFEHMKLPGIRYVPGTGPLNPKLMLIGEAPGKLENARGVPFVGRAGENLMNILSDVGIDSHEVYITNAVKFLPLESDRRMRTPSMSEMEASREYLAREIDIVNPKVVGLCGRIPLMTILPGAGPFRAIHGQLLHGKFVPLYHPAVITYKVDLKADVKQGYRKLNNYM